MGEWDHLPSGKYNWEEAVETLPGGKYYMKKDIQYRNNIINFELKKVKRMEIKSFEDLKKFDAEKNNKQVAKYPTMPWCHEVLAKSRASHRAEQESPLKIWLLEEERKKRSEKK